MCYIMAYIIDNEKCHGHRSDLVLACKEHDVVIDILNTDSESYGVEVINAMNMHREKVRKLERSG